MKVDIFVPVWTLKYPGSCGLSSSMTGSLQIIGLIGIWVLKQILHFFFQMLTTLVPTVTCNLWTKVILIFTWSVVKFVVMLIHKRSSVENVEKCLLNWSTFNGISGDMNKINNPTSVVLRPHEVTYSLNSKISLPANDSEHFQCKFCGKSFTQSVDLQSHIEIHNSYERHDYSEEIVSLVSNTEYLTERTPKQCKYCGKSFKTKWELNRHLLTHTGEKPYKCKDCTKSFADSSSCHISFREETFTVWSLQQKFFRTQESSMPLTDPYKGKTLFVPSLH